jgi:hypothetical protein
MVRWGAVVRQRLQPIAVQSGIRVATGNNRALN